MLLPQIPRIRSGDILPFLTLVPYFKPDPPSWTIFPLFILAMAMAENEIYNFIRATFCCYLSVKKLHFIFDACAYKLFVLRIYFDLSSFSFCFFNLKISSFLFS